MSQENVEKVEAAYDAWNKGDFDAAFEFADPELEIDGKIARITGFPSEEEAIEAVGASE